MSDNGTQFTSAEFKEFLKQRQILHLRASVYYPQATGEVKWFNRVLKDCLHTTSIQGTSWKSFIRSFLMDCRATPHATTRISPSCLLQILDVIPAPGNEGAVRERVKDKQEKSKQYIDVKRSANQHFSPRDQVRFRKPWKFKKGEQKFTQPRTVVTEKPPHIPAG